jgi:hypothetical protein
VPILPDDESLNQSSLHPVRGSWLRTISQYLFDRRGHDHHRDEDEEPSECKEDENESIEESGIFITSQTYGNGIEISESRSSEGPEQRSRLSRSSALGNDETSPRLTVRGVHHFSQGSKSLRDYQRVKGKQNNSSNDTVRGATVDRERDENGLRQRKLV